VDATFFVLMGCCHVAVTIGMGWIGGVRHISTLLLGWCVGLLVTGVLVFGTLVLASLWVENRFFSVNLVDEEAMLFSAFYLPAVIATLVWRRSNARQE
jgi:hypothetical protein